MLKLLLAVLLPALCLDGCSGSGRAKHTVGNRQIQGHYDSKSGKLTSITYDSNNDGKTDTWSYMDGARVVRIDIDKDQDGRIDRWEYYGPDQKLEKVGYSRTNNGIPDAWAYQGPDGKIAKLELAAPQATGGQPVTASAVGTGTNRQAVVGSGLQPGTIARIVRTEFYDNGVLVRAEEDTNGDGRPDKWETFSNGALASVAFDTTGRGTPDRRLVYETGGRVRVEEDRQGSGVFKGARQ